MIEPGLESQQSDSRAEAFNGYRIMPLINK